MAYTHGTSSKKEHSSSLLLISALFLLIHRIETLVVHTTVGGDAVLPCEVDPTHDEREVEWTRPDIPKDEYVYYQRNGVEIGKRNLPYEGRTSLFVDEVKKGNVSLKLSLVKSSDAGSYTCRVPEFQKVTVVQLIVDPEIQVPSVQSLTEVSPVGEFPWWGVLLIGLCIIISGVVIGLGYKKRRSILNCSWCIGRDYERGPTQHTIDGCQYVNQVEPPLPADTPVQDTWLTARNQAPSEALQALVAKSVNAAL